MLTISQLARRFGLSRSTLLYYDSIGLLSPSERSGANYRLYSPQDVRRMELIDLYRKTGLPLADIARVVSSDKGKLARVLESRLRALNGEIQDLRRQQHLIIQLLRRRAARRGARWLDKDAWVTILRATGMGEEDMRRWHVEFERFSPEAHQDFLESLGLGAEEIARIRGWSRAPETIERQPAGRGTASGAGRSPAPRRHGRREKARRAGRTQHTNRR
jgi:DNA-binding transcriptional MerR regulator